VNKPFRTGFWHYTIQKIEPFFSQSLQKIAGCVILPGMALYSLYFHIPFCQTRCYYCDFNTYAGMEGWMPEYTAALCSEIEQVACQAPERLEAHTLFFGGGTPSLLSIGQVEAILSTVRKNFTLTDNLEASLEANPGTVSLESLKGLRNLGINRLSLGMQSANPEELRLMGRIHDTHDVIQAVKWARQAGFENLNLDLIFGLPSQTLERWQSSVELALSLNPDHLSMYALTVEEGTPFHRWTERGLMPMPDDDLAADCYEWASERIDKSGFIQYEISNWGRKVVAVNGEVIVMACRHNLQYWRTLPYLGFGAGAHGFAAGVRTANVAPIPAYINLCKAGMATQFPVGPAALETRAIDPLTEMQETMMLGLRLVDEGVSMNGFEDRFHTPMEAVFAKEIHKLTDQGLLEVIQGKVRLTKSGRLLGNRVFMEFV
jgi:oxygen-independent coproporphyrinogen-3 oxidase